MSKISSMSMENIINQTELILKENDIIYFCDDSNVIDEFKSKFAQKINKPNDIRNFFINHESSIDKEKFLLLMAYNYQCNIKEMSEELKEYENQNSEEAIRESLKLHIKIKSQQAILEKITKLGKGLDTFITCYYYDDNEQRYRVEVIDSRKVIDNKKINSTKNVKRFDEIDLYFKGGDKNAVLGMEYIIQALVLTDFYRIFPNDKFGNDIRTMVLENGLISKGTKTKEEIQALKTQETLGQYIELLDSADFKDLLPDIKNTLREYAAYIDIDKMLLIAAYRFNEGLESKIINEKQVFSARDILIGIQNTIKRYFEISLELQSKENNDYIDQEIHYSTKDIELCIKQFAKNRYITKAEMSEIKEKINNHEMELLQLPFDEIDIIFSAQELEKISRFNEENLIYCLVRYNWDTNKIMEALAEMPTCSSDLISDLIDNKEIGVSELITLYEQGNISIESIHEIKNSINWDKAINFETLDTYYKQYKQNPDDNKLSEKYKKYIDLYKEIFVDGKSEEESNKYSNQLIEKLIENYEGKSYAEIIKEYYQKGILTLGSIAEWNDEELISNLYHEGTISMDDIKKLVREHKLSFDFLMDEYSNLICNKDLDYDERLKIILETGLVSEENIENLFNQNLLFEEDLKKIAQKGVITEETLERILNERTKEKLEENSTIKLVGLNRLSKKYNMHPDTYSGYGYQIKTSKENKKMIDPNERANLLSLLKAYRAETDLDEESPFYHYEFYVIPDESGDIGLNSVVIAERYYDDKLTETKFATDNATYFFQYKDLMVLSNLKKSEMTKERKNIVFTSNHYLANDKRERTLGSKCNK